MWPRPDRRAAFAALLLCALGLGTGCFRNKSLAGGAPERAVLFVNNRGYFDVAVYAIRFVGELGHRVGNVPGNTQQTVFVPASDLLPGGQLMLSVRAIGSRFSWTSPTVNVGPGIIARLDVYSTNAGDLSQSQLYTFLQPPPDTSSAPVDTSGTTAASTARPTPRRAPALFGR